MRRMDGKDGQKKMRTQTLRSERMVLEIVRLGEQVLASSKRALLPRRNLQAGATTSDFRQLSKQTFRFWKHVVMVWCLWIMYKYKQISAQLVMTWSSVVYEMQFDTIVGTCSVPCMFLFILSLFAVLSRSPDRCDVDLDGNHLMEGTMHDA